ncbi:MAG: 1-(5-phosphoribosyl)-5-[(5-phosphoribosylamino)methylideneamino]imidazole-4-carboxamide isomerase [Erysipelotrichaceae bacterium]|nr:1-(5-phosphoribosyl)-5-[(5-phosphoribosylamino)methylideneamino]imidazole-4-carboxamide isomerase [Erysipelotrichaceae bacterium]
MKLYPAIDLHDGKAVRLYKGDYAQVTEYGDPVEMAKKWKSLGATFLHLVDLDGAKDGKFANLEAVKGIVATGIDCELGGGVRDLSHIEALLNVGVKRVILGSSALNLEFVKSAVEKFGNEKIVIGIDCKNMMVATHGWLNVTDISAVEFALKLKEIGIKTIIFTDIAKDGTLEGINVLQTKRMVDETGLEIIASGGAKTSDDIKNAKEIGCCGIILGKSIYSGAIDLEEAIKKFED